MTRSTPSSEQSEHRTIWLEPSCVDEAGEDRHWCQDDAWGPCEDCGRAPVKYVIASEYDSLQSRLSAQDKRVEELEKALHSVENEIARKVDQLDEHLLKHCQGDDLAMVHARKTTEGRRLQANMDLILVSRALRPQEAADE